MRTMLISPQEKLKILTLFPPPCFFTVSVGIGDYVGSTLSLSGHSSKGLSVMRKNYNIQPKFG